MPCNTATATACQAAGTLSRLHVSLDWVRAAEAHEHDSSQSALNVYACCLRLLDSHISAAAPISSRYDAMKHFPVDLSVDAVSCAIRCGNVPHASELLEQGQALPCTRMARFHTSLDDLRSSDSCTALPVQRFQELSSILKTKPADKPCNEGAPRAPADVKAETLRYRQLAAEWNDVAEEIRKFEGLSRFLLPPLFADLAEAACEGPVIVLIASRFSCDGVVVLHSPRCKASDQRSQNKICSPKESRNEFAMVLRESWREVVSFVVNELKGVTKKGSRLLTRQKYLALLYISSYTPTLMTLVRVRKNASKGSSSPILFAAIGQAQPGGQWASLPFVERELHSHFEERFKSSFAMRDDPLSLLDIVDLDLSHHGFAFLSACKTAVGDSTVPDEVIHLAAGLQFMGVNSVLVSKFYEFGKGDRLDCTMADPVLHRSAARLRKEEIRNGTISLHEAFVFIHIGM
ncbi:hypothetical protein PAXRUDRAFT_33013 [Paxillus rubicundulus Ve08.2h10]|uniref:CHAT domain-containing protein n=1 Tax=Paxillus rubicundulus Ve08.2h10 TaxID=930991 RepID=A0A0D0E902_9AGAM|nr:hypothetical protein PAXRUDRAFT_33013 [Paxillus rubicundulus Ve08.2h10]